MGEIYHDIVDLLSVKPLHSFCFHSSHENANLENLLSKSPIIIIFY